MSNNDNAANNSSSVPFFARYLEGQFMSELSEEEMDRVKGGKIASLPIEDIVYSLKYPSDNDEAMTHKYPSDGDDDFSFDELKRS